MAKLIDILAWELPRITLRFPTARVIRVSRLDLSDEDGAKES